MKVIDASVLVPALTDEGSVGPRARDLFATDDLVAPELIDLEFASALRRLARQGVVEADRAVLTLRDLAEMPIVRSPHLPLLDRIWELRDNLSAYDAAYVALAELMQCELLTADRRLARAPGVRCEIALVR